jgi:hypothetical protein
VNIPPRRVDIQEQTDCGYKSPKIELSLEEGLMALSLLYEMYHTNVVEVRIVAIC